MNTLTKLLATSAAALSFSFAGSAHAQQTHPAPVALESAAVANAAESPGPALWRVSDEDTTIYLFGTVHALPKGLDWHKGQIAQALAASDTVVFEIPMGAQDGARLQQYVLAEGVLPAGTTLRSLMNDEQRATYEGALAQLAIPAHAFDKYEPWLAAMTISLLPLMKEGYSPEQGVEKQVEKIIGPGKKRDALETMEYQIGVFDGLDMDTQVNFLIETAGSLDEIKPALDAMVKEWYEGDTKELGELMNASLSDPKVAEALLYTRNANWAGWIDERLDTPGTVFIAVGAGHLAGEKSLQDMLAARQIHANRIQ